MEKSYFLEKMKTLKAILALSLLGILVFSCNNKVKEGSVPLKLAISPYQDLAMIVNLKNLDLEKKYNLKVELQTLPWEEIIPAISSAGETVDVGFASYVEFITKSNNLNKNSKDSIVFIYPAYIFAGGGFTTFKKDFPVLDEKSAKNPALIKKFLSYKIGAQKNSMFDMAIYRLANSVSMDIKDLKVIDTPMSDGILALQSGSLDFAAAGLTQRNEVEKQGGKVALSFKTLGFADITGFICKKSVLEKRRAEIEKLIKIWFECVSYVTSDVDKHVGVATLPYLAKNASTKYTIETYKNAISQEIFPNNIVEANKIIIADSAHFSGTHIYETVSNYLVKNKIVTYKPSKPKFITVN